MTVTRFCLLIILLNNCAIIFSGSIKTIRTLSDDVDRDFVGLAKKYGRSVKEYNVATDDGYILKLFNIPGDIKRPVLLMHGIVDSADTFIIRGNGSLAIVLSKSGYDVWVGNSRGARYSRNHIYLSPDIDDEFWDFSFEEIGYYDMPALIDFVLEKTKQESLSAVAHSQGNTVFYVLGAMRPEYNKKVKVLIALSPVCFLDNIKSPASEFLMFMPSLNRILKTFSGEEFFGDNSTLRAVYRGMCGHRNSYDLCARGIFFRIGGADPDEMEPEFFPVVVSHYPTGTSSKNGIHLSQVIASGKFAQFDYGSLNLDLYNSETPPEFDLGKVSMPVALLAGKNDGISKLRDVEKLRNQLGNVVEYRVLSHKLFNHLDAVWGRNMKDYLFPHIFKILKKYN